MNEVFDPAALAQSLDELWSPRVAAELDDHYVKVARLHGELAWHAHDHEDELFFVLRGRLRIEMQERCVELGPGQAFVVPRGMRHHPVAEHECLVMLVEKKSTAHTGREATTQTRSLAEQLRPL